MELIIKHLTQFARLETEKRGERKDSEKTEYQRKKCHEKRKRKMEIEFKLFERMKRNPRKMIVNRRKEREKEIRKMKLPKIDLLNRPKLNANMIHLSRNGQIPLHSPVLTGNQNNIHRMIHNSRIVKKEKMELITETTKKKCPRKQLNQHTRRKIVVNDEMKFVVPSSQNNTEMEDTEVEIHGEEMMEIEEITREEEMKLTIEDYRKDLRIQLRNELNKYSIFGCQERRNWIWKNRNDVPLLFQLCAGIELLYPTSVKSECSFSKMNLIKTPSRNRLSDESLDSIMRIQYASKEDVVACINNLVNINIKETKQKKIID